MDPDQASEPGFPGRMKAGFTGFQPAFATLIYAFLLVRSRSGFALPAHSSARRAPKCPPPYRCGLRRAPMRAHERHRHRRCGYNKCRHDCLCPVRPTACCRSSVSCRKTRPPEPQRSVQPFAQAAKFPNRRPRHNRFERAGLH